MNRKIVFVLFIIFTSIFLIAYSISTTAAPPPPSDADHEIEKERIEEAILQIIDGQKEYVLGYLLNDIQIKEIQISQDETQGVVYLEMVDPETGDTLPTEPGLAFALKSDGDWKVILPSDPGWIELVGSAPPELLTDESKVAYVEMFSSSIQTTQAPFSGYLLPWDAGRTVYLSQSTGHDRYIPSGSAHYSFDFYIPQTMYQLRASKAGTVWRTRWEVSNGNDDDMGNYIVLKDESTSPTTYQLYLHLAKDSIPKELRKTGAYVAQGQIIGVADDTGQSTGHHLHFQVHTNPDSYWGTSVDITFKDVDINGGRPRRESDLEYCTRPDDVCSQYRNYYVSGNVAPGDTTPPIGDLFEPETGLLVNSNSVSFDGWVFDEDSGINRTRLVAYFDNEWHEVGEEIPGSTISGSWDMCKDGVPNGPVSIALKIRDNAGNFSSGLPGLTHIIKNFNCPSDLIQCVPGADQISIYSSRDFQGSCQVLEIGGYANLPLEMDNNIESIKVGTNVIGEVFGGTDFSDRAESIFRDDSSLDDNLIRGDQIKSVKVSLKSSLLIAPQILLHPQPGAKFEYNASIPFSWRYSGPGNEFQVNIIGPSVDIKSGWQPSPFWIADNLQLAVGNYTWKVRTRSCVQLSCISPWSEISTFEITAAPPALLSITAPLTDSLESGTGNWTLPTGLWNLITDPEHSHSVDHAWYYGLPELNYDTHNPNSGALTSRPILIPEDNYLLQFWYWYNTEHPGTNWDQRWVQISTNGSSFHNVIQLNSDVENYWLQETLDLAQYAGQTIQVRFLFSTLDAVDNANGEGWFIDDIEIVQGVLPDCDDSNDSPSTAETINFNQTIAREICPAGDIDYYKFEGQAGDHIVLDINTSSSNPVENLDLILFLLDGDGHSELAQHDDEIFGTLLDPLLGYQLKRTGTYYVRANLWSHPSYGGDDFDYELTLRKDNNSPQGNLIQPLSNSYINQSVTFDLLTDANDQDSGISYVQFLYHSGEWLASDWQEIGKDLDGFNGWGITLDANDYPELKGAAFFANIYDWAGNWKGSGIWDIGFDRTPPVTNMQSLEAVQQSTAIELSWSGSDNLSGIDYFQLQSKLAGGDWSNINPSSPASELNRWFIGQPGSTYSFRMRGIDLASNFGAFPQLPETSTTILDPAGLCSAPDIWDRSSNDNSPEHSTKVYLMALPTVHNFCNPLADNRLNDEDWVNFEVELGQAYLLESRPTGAVTATILELYASDGTTMLASSQSAGFNEISRIIWTADRSGKVYLRARHTDGRIAGNIVSYQLKVNKYLPIFLPFIH